MKDTSFPIESDAKLAQWLKVWPCISVIELGNVIDVREVPDNYLKPNTLTVEGIEIATKFACKSKAASAIAIVPSLTA